MKLSAEQIEIIKLMIGQSKITIETLKDDLLDHLCCVVEDKMTKGNSYETSFAEALKELAPNGLNQIQNETVFLLNSTKIIRMKKIMYAIGLLSAMAFVSGWVFGMLHLPGARELSIYGFFGFAFIFLPMLALNHFKTSIHKAMSEKLKLILGLASGVLVGLSVVLKILHLPGAPGLLLAGSGLFVFGFLPFLFFTMYKKSVS